MSLTDSQREKSIIGSLRAERNSHGFTQSELGSEIGINPTTICAWENDGGRIGLEEAWRIADLYGISLDQLAGRDIVFEAKRAE